MFPSVLIESLSVRQWRVTSVRSCDSFTFDVSRHLNIKLLQILIILRHMRATVKVFKQCIVKPSSLERTDREREKERRTNILIFVKVLLRFALGFVLIPAL